MFLKYSRRRLYINRFRHFDFKLCFNKGAVASQRFPDFSEQREMGLGSHLLPYLGLISVVKIDQHAIKKTLSVAGRRLLSQKRRRFPD